MKITSIHLVPANGLDPCVLSFKDPRRLNPYNVKNADGLDADEIVSKYYGGGTQKYYALSVIKREPVLQIGLNPRFGQGESYSGLRDDLARMIASTRTGSIQICFFNDTIQVACLTARVAKFESDLFDKDPYITITFTCDDGTLRAPEETILPAPSYNPGLTVITDANSTAPHGLKFSLLVNALSTGLVLRDPDDDTWAFQLSETLVLFPDDVLHFSSEPNNRYVYVVHGIQTYHVADSIIAGSMWPVVFPGQNKFALDNPGNFDWLTMSYFDTYWGI